MYECSNGNIILYYCPIYYNTEMVDQYERIATTLSYLGHTHNKKKIQSNFDQSLSVIILNGVVFVIHTFIHEHSLNVYTHTHTKKRIEHSPLPTCYQLTLLKWKLYIQNEKPKPKPKKNKKQPPGIHTSCACHHHYRCRRRPSFSMFVCLCPTQKSNIDMANDRKKTCQV